MGFYAKYWSTLLKNSFATRLKERVEIRRIEKFGGRITRLLFHEFPRLVEKEHKVTEFLRKLDTFIDAFKRVCHNSFNVMFNQLTQDMAELKEEDGVIVQLSEYWGKTSRRELRDIERKALLRILQEDKKDETMDRQEYREVEAIILEAKKVEEDHEKFMDWLRTRIKTRAQLRNVLERFAWKRSVSISGREIGSARSLRDKLKKTLAKISRESNVGSFDRLSKELETELNQICNEIGVFFRESYLVRERAILMVLRVLYLAESADIYLQRMIEKHYIPKNSGELAREKLARVINDLGRDFHDVIAQEFRIVVHKLEIEEAKAGKLARAA